MRKKLLFAANIAVFAGLIFIALEMTIRVYLFGLAGLNPLTVNSFENLLNSEWIKPADNPEIWYELKPDQNVLFRGARLRTNSHGLADDEYTYEKPPNTFRIAVIGSSWTMGSGVAVEETFHAVLEQAFNHESTATRYEFINFGVENYGLGEMIGTLKHKALRYDPDMILFVITGITPYILWQTHDEPFSQEQPIDSGWRSYAVLRLTDKLGIKREHTVDNAEKMEAIPLDDRGLYFNQLQRSFDELALISTTDQIPAATVWLRLNRNDADNSKLANVFLRRAEEANIAAAVVDLDQYLQPGESIRRLLVNRVEKHPNAYGHKIIATELREKIFSDIAPPPPAP